MRESVLAARRAAQVENLVEAAVECLGWDMRDVEGLVGPEFLPDLRARFTALLVASRWQT